MPFNAKSGKFNAAIKEVEIGCGEKAIKLGGENVLPFYTFDAPITNAPKVGVEVCDLFAESIENSEGLKEFYAGIDNVADAAKKAATMEGADFVCLRLASADPNGEDASVETCVETAKAVAEAVGDVPLAIMGCGNDDKDADLLVKVGEAVTGKNVLILSAKEENYKNIGLSSVQACHHKVAAESAVDINLAKQINVLLSQLGVSAENVVMNIGTATAGYGYEYVSSTLDRIKAAALAQNDDMLQMPIVTPVSTDTYNCKESLATEESMPEWGSQDVRIIDMEVVTAAADLASGSNAVILRHPVSVATVKTLINELV